MRRLLAFLIFKLKDGQNVEIYGHDYDISKVVMVAEILKERIGWLHQITGFLNIARKGDGEKKGKLGICIKLSRDPLE